MASEHKYKIGQSVYFRLKVSKAGELAGAPYQIIQRLPGATGGIRYRLRSADGQERIADERVLRPASKFAGRRRAHG